MYKDIRANFYYFILDFRFTISVFWSIFIASMFVLYLISISTNATIIIVSPSLAVYIFCAISGFIMTKESFPFSIKMGSTRNGYISSSYLFFIILAGFMALLELLVSGALTYLMHLSNVSGLKIYNTVDITVLPVTWYNQLFIDFTANLLLLFLGFLLGSTFYKFGSIGGITTIALFGVVLLTPELQEPLLKFFGTLQQNKVDINIININLLALISIIPTWIFLRKATIFPGVTR